jgi:hypothetical protein
LTASREDVRKLLEEGMKKDGRPVILKGGELLGGRSVEF